MEIEDFRDNFKYKLIIPSVYILSWVGMFVGPYYFPAKYQLLCMIFLFYAFVKSSMLIVGAIVAFYKSMVILNR